MNAHTAQTVQFIKHQTQTGVLQKESLMRQNIQFFNLHLIECELHIKNDYSDNPERGVHTLAQKHVLHGCNSRK